MYQNARKCVMYTTVLFLGWGQIRINAQPFKDISSFQGCVFELFQGLVLSGGAVVYVCRVVRKHVVPM